MARRHPGSDSLCQLLAIRKPILLAGMAGGPTTPELVAAVSEAGGLGVFGLTGMSARAAGEAVAAARRLTGAPIGVNVLVAGPTEPDARGRDPREVIEPLARELPPAPAPEPPSGTRDLVTAGLEAGASVVTVGLGDAGLVADLARDAGAPLVVMVSTVADARRAVAGGAHAVVAQGAEAGGHRSDFTLPPDGTPALVGTFALVPQVVAAVDVPVVAAGAIMDGRGLAAALALGAEGVQMGTRFLLAAESGVPAGYRARLLAARDDESVITRALSGRPARALPNRLLEALESAGPPALGYPFQAAASGPLRVAAGIADEPELMGLLAGQASGLADGVLGAAEIVERTMAEARVALEGISLPG